MKKVTILLITFMVIICCACSDDNSSSNFLEGTTWKLIEDDGKNYVKFELTFEEENYQLHCYSCEHDNQFLPGDDSDDQFLSGLGYQSVTECSGSYSILKNTVILSMISSIGDPINVVGIISKNSIYFSEISGKHDITLRRE